MVPAFEFNTRWVRMVHATFGVLGIPRSLLPTGYYGMIRTMATRLNIPGVLVQAILSGVVPLRPAGPSVFWRPLFTYTPVQPRVIASKAKCVFPLVMPSKTVVTVYNGACDTPTQLAYLAPRQSHNPNSVETMPLAATASEPACPLVVATRVRRVPFGPARPVVPVQPTCYSIHPQWVWEIRSAFVASQLPRTVLTIDGFHWIALRYLRVSGALVELVVALGLGLTPAGTAIFAPVDAPAATPVVELDSGSALVADNHVSVVPQTPLDLLRIALRLTVKLTDGVLESVTTDRIVALDAPVRAPQSVSVQLSGVRSLVKPAGSRVIAVKIKKRVPFGPVKPVAPVHPVRSIPPEWVAIRSVFGLPQTPRTLPTSGEFYWSARRYFGTPGTRIVLTIPDGLVSASSGSGISSEQLRIRFRSTATASIAAPASTTVDESDPRSALVADRHIRSAATQTLFIFLRIVHRLCHQETDYATPLLESPLVLTLTDNTDDVAPLGAPVEPALLVPVQTSGPSAAIEGPLPTDKPVRPRVIAIKVKQRVPFGPAKPVVSVQPVHPVSREWVQQICNVFCPPQVPRSLPTSHGLYWITLRYFGTAGALPHGLTSASPVSLEQVYLRLRSAAFAHSGQRSALVAGRRRFAAAQILLVFLRLVLGFIESTDATLDLESPSVPTSRDGTVNSPAFGIEHVSSSPSPASRVAEDLQADTSTEGELPVSSERKRKRHPRARGGKKVQASKTRKMERQALEAEKSAQRAEQNDGVDKNQAASSPTDAAIQNGNSDASGSNIGTGGSTRRRQPTRGRQTRRTEGKSEGASAQDGSSVQTQGGRRNRGTGADGLGAGAMRIANAHIRQAVGSQFVQLPPLRLGTPRTAATDEFAATA
ncbi:uncharacterized protein B0H18DRAFT_312051 [Fomitopsis serialis]|uniref:uncharacterized protein n=1 Tax=Fomitopsis serialis TaxID=139415 RepID=UPI002007CA12|nr:uncharacterized protein B0H18DRAFT_312051 [Neoantrodia serialis]KAH9936092.1 hypothetical protein B0H18DRAFT_312051 [Neoantrodia serialis]